MRKGPHSRAEALVLPQPATASLRLSSRWPRALKALWHEECEHGLLPLLVPLAFSAGIASYFAAGDEPIGSLVALLALASAVFAVIKRRHFTVFVGCGLMAIYLAGIAVPALKAAMMPPPLPAGPMRMVEVSGFVTFVEARKGGTRFIIEGGEAGRLRLTSRRAEDVTIGDAVRLRARVGATGGPNYPGGYDFARDAFFQGIAGSGFVMGRIDKADLGPPPALLRLKAVIHAARQAVSARIRSHIAGESGLIADALVTGKRDGLSNASNDVLRAAGVFHILSVSGFHMALVTLMVFAVVRGLLALIPAVALHHPTKALAAGVALFIAMLYLLLSGAEVATQRSFVMIAVVLIGTMLGREALSLRTLGVAVILVLLVSPESLLSPSFQMSFAATLALVSGLRLAQPWLEAMPDRKNRLRRIGRALTHGITGLAMSSFLAGLATTPYAAFHFQTIQFYGLLGNLLGAPIIEFLTMPLEILALLLWPFGFDGLVWTVVGLSIDWFMATARFVASLSGGTLHIRAFAMPALLLMTLGLLIAGLLKTRLRLAGLIPLAAGVLMAFVHERPVGFVDRMGTTALLNEALPVVVGQRPNAFATGQWLSALGRNGEGLTPQPGRCDRQGCSGGTRWRVALSASVRSLADDCAEADLVISRVPASQPCAAQVLTWAELRAMGGLALYERQGRLVIAPAEPRRGHRPWQGNEMAAAQAPVIVTEGVDNP